VKVISPIIQQTFPLHISSTTVIEGLLLCYNSTY